jgi:hypothetical protein
VAKNDPFTWYQIANTTLSRHAKRLERVIEGLQGDSDLSGAAMADALMNVRDSLWLLFYTLKDDETGVHAPDLMLELWQWYIGQVDEAIRCLATDGDFNRKGVVGDLNDLLATIQTLRLMVLAPSLHVTLPHPGWFLELTLTPAYGDGKRMK